MDIINKSDKKAVTGVGYCVYFLYFEDEIVYIGQTSSLYSRLKGHSNQKVFDSFSFLVAEQGDLNDLESSLIVKHNPIYNRSIPVNKRYVGFNSLSNQLDAIARFYFNDNVVFTCNYNEKSNKGLTYVDQKFVKQFIDHVESFTYDED